jgi:hypothetical protein
MHVVEPHRCLPAHRAKNLIALDPEIGIHLRRRPVEVVSGIDIQGNWLFGVELRQVNSLTLAKLSAVGPDGVHKVVGTCPLGELPASFELRYLIQALNGTEFGALSLKFDDEHTIDLDTAPIRLLEFRLFAPEGRELVAPWMTLALSA